MLKFRIRRALVLERRDRVLRVAQLKRDMRTWSWWSFMLTARVIPVVMFSVVCALIGATWGIKWFAEEAAQRFECVEKVSHAN